MALKIIFAGTPEFAAPSLQALIKSEHSVCAVYTQPDRPAGRGLKLTPSAIKNLALANNLVVLQPETLKDQTVQKTMHDFGADILVDVAYGLFLPKEVLTMFNYGCINVHPSLLPRWRGAAPIQRALLAGDTETGVTIMQVDEGWDTGDILAQIKIGIKQKDTSASLHQNLAEIGADLLLKILEKIEARQIQPLPQDEKLSCYAKKIIRDEARLDWSLDAMQLERAVRAFNPWPVAFSSIDDQLVKIWQAEAIASTGDKLPGSIIKTDKNGIYVATGNGVLGILELQLPGGKRLSAGSVLNAKQKLFTVGKRFDG
jgi:methionyl-tRNA formyltransferase